MAENVTINIIQNWERISKNNASYLDSAVADVYEEVGKAGEGELLRALLRDVVELHDRIQDKDERHLDIHHGDTDHSIHLLHVHKLVITAINRKNKINLNYNKTGVFSHCRKLALFKPFAVLMFDL